MNRMVKINNYKLRIKKLREAIEKENLDAILLLKDKNIFYITGFYGKDSGSFLLIDKNNIYLIVHFIYFEQAKKSSREGIEIIQFRSKKYKKLKTAISAIEGKKIGIEEKNVNLEEYKKIKEISKRFSKNLISAGSILENLRVVKDQIEIDYIKKSCNIADIAIKNILDTEIKRIYNYSEIEIAFDLERYMIKAGASGKSFDIIVANNSNSALPHHVSGKEKIKPGLLLMDFGCIYNNYCSDITRTFFINNKNNHKFKKIYDIVLQAQLLAIEKCKEGITCKELDKVARDYISKNGYGNNFGHSLGHGVGLEVHEMPIVSNNYDTVLKENMIITIEPGIYVEGFGGVRIEDMVLIKKESCEVLYNTNKSYINITE